MLKLPKLDSVIKEIKELVKDERIRPEPEYHSFCKYLATFSKEEFLKDEEILHLIHSHGVQLRNDVKYWLDKNTFDSREDLPNAVPIIDTQNLIIEGYDNLIEKLKELPSEWTVIQITKKFSLLNTVRNEEKKKLSGIHITRLACGELAKRVHPYGVTIDEKNSQENIFTVLKDLANMRREYFTMGRTCKKLRNDYYKTNSDLMSFIKELESYLLRQWICLIRGRIEDPTLESDLLEQVRDMISFYCKNEKIEMLNDTQLNIIYQLTLSAHLLKGKWIFYTLQSVLFKNEPPLSSFKELKLLVEKIKILNLSRDCAIKRANYNPVILILDNDFEMVSWEMISTLSDQPVCRISSFHLLYALYKYHQPYIKNGYRMVEIDSMYCLINPSKDLESCEKEMTEFLQKRVPWAEVQTAEVPEPKHLISKFKDYSAYLYCGHGTGMHYLDERELKKAFVKSLVLLFGCSSNIPKNAGGRTPHQNNTYTYICNGCPCIVGCLQDVGSSDADEACKAMLSSFMPRAAAGKDVGEPEEPNVLRALVVGKNACTRYWSKSAFIARGLPCKTVIGDRDKIKFK